MIQRIIFSAIQTGLAAFQTNTDLYTELFGDVWQLSPDEIAIIAQYFTANPPTVMHAYAHQQPRFPLVVIEVRNEMQPLFSLADYGGPGATQAGGAGGTQITAGTLSSFFTHSLDIHIQTAKEPELAFYLYEMVKYVLVAAKQFFLGLAVQLPAMSGGDVREAQLGSGDVVFERTLSFQAQREFAVIDAASALGKVFSITGLQAPTTLNQGQPQLISTILTTGPANG